jgi:hypothetical protein
VNVSCVPHVEQQHRTPFRLDRKLAASPATMRNSKRRTLNQVTKGAPVARRQIEQWQFVWWNGAPLTS